MSPKSRSILIVDDHALLAESLAFVMRDHGFADVHVVTDDVRPEHVLDVAGRVRPDVVLLDLQLGERELSVPLVAPLRQLGATVLVLTAAHQNPRVFAECLEAGAAGLFDKANSIDELVDALEGAARGEQLLEPEQRRTMLTDLRHHRRREHERRRPLSALTPREAETLASLMEGKSADDIANERGVAPSTVRAQIKSILRKLGVNSQLSAVALAHSVGWRAPR